MGANFSNRRNLPLGMRNNNPGNIRPVKGSLWVGQVGVNKNFVVFNDIIYGIRAIMKNALTQIQKNGKNTVAKYVSAYAPPTENNTAKYINAVKNALGLGANDKIPTDYKTLHKLVRVHLILEVGNSNSDLISDGDISEAFLKL